MATRASNLRAMVREYSLRTLMGDLVTWLVVFGTLFGLTFAAGHYLGLWVAGLIAVVLGIVWLAGCVLALLYEEDWWNDFVGQDTMLIVCVLSSVAIPAIGVWAGNA